MAYVDVIRRWFAAELGGGLILPDGWFGRPYDNQYSLTSIEEDGTDLAIVLSEHLLLRFSGLNAVTPKGRELVFGAFDKLYFEWMPFGGGSMQTQEYRGGEAIIAAPPG
jgi:hypothetical protein